MEHIKLADTKRIAGMFLGREQLCLLVHPDYYANTDVNSWEMINIPQLPRPLSPIPATPPQTP